jgi:hypothetical protein
MKIMLSSFGVGERYLDIFSGSAQSAEFCSPYQRSLASPPIFRHLPPLDMRMPSRGLRLEYSLLLLCDQVILDISSFERLLDEPDPALKSVSQTIKLLRNEGFLQLVDYDGILEGNARLLEKMTDNDLKSVDQWLDTLASSGRIWSKFIASVGPAIGVQRPRFDQSGVPLELEHMPVHFAVHARSHQPARAHDREFTRMKLGYYLTYVNANLILSNATEAGLHDWADFAPFYRQKFLTVGHDDPPGSAEADASHQLFELAFPEFAIDSPQQLLKVLQDRRVRELRSLIKQASTGSVVFDEAFARAVFGEVLGVEWRLAKKRRLLGYLTLPISFIPFVGTYAQLLAQEVAGTVLERRLTKPYRWFYLLSDLGHQEGHSRLPG